MDLSGPEAGLGPGAAFAAPGPQGPGYGQLVSGPAASGGPGIRRLRGPGERSTTALVSAARDTGVQRIVQLSSFLAAPNYKPNLAGKLMGPMLNGMLSDKSAGEELLTRSGLDWTIVYVTGLDKAKDGQPVRIVDPADKVSMRNGIARFMLAELSEPAHHHGKVVLTAK